MTQEGTEDRIFVLEEAPVPAAGAGVIDALEVGRNDRTDGAEAKNFPNLLLGHTSNLRLEDMSELRRQWITIDDDNDLAMVNVPRQGETAAGTSIWRREVIICPRKAGNLQNSFASFRHYFHDALFCMSRLNLFLIMSPEGYLEQVIIPDTNKGLRVSMDIQEFIKWVGCWIYME